MTATVTMYHGTPARHAEAIRESGHINRPCVIDDARGAALYAARFHPFKLAKVIVLELTLPEWWLTDNAHKDAAHLNNPLGPGRAWRSVFDVPSTNIVRFVPWEVEFAEVSVAHYKFANGRAEITENKIVASTPLIEYQDGEPRMHSTAELLAAMQALPERKTDPIEGPYEIHHVV